MAASPKTTPTLDDILEVYNSISPSRRRWFRNRNELRNRWKELFQALEAASGRDGAKIKPFDPNWHEVAKKGNTSGAKNKKAPKQLDIVEEVAKVETPAVTPEVKSDTTKEASDVLAASEATKPRNKKSSK